MTFHNININFNIIVLTDDTVKVIISEPTNNTLCKRLNLVILNLYKYFINNRIILN